MIFNPTCVLYTRKLRSTNEVVYGHHTTESGLQAPGNSWSPINTRVSVTSMCFISLFVLLPARLNSSRFNPRFYLRRVQGVVSFQHVSGLSRSTCALCIYTPTVSSCSSFMWMRPQDNDEQIQSYWQSKCKTCSQNHQHAETEISVQNESVLKILSFETFC